MARYSEIPDDPGEYLNPGDPLPKRVRRMHLMAADTHAWLTSGGTGAKPDTHDDEVE